MLPLICSGMHSFYTILVCLAFGLSSGENSNGQQDVTTARVGDDQAEVDERWPELEDFDCDLKQGTAIIWSSLRTRVREFDKNWHIHNGPPAKLCPERAGLGPQGIIDEQFRSLLSHPRHGVDECPMGTLAASIVASACSSDCGAGADGQVEYQAEYLLTPLLPSPVFPDPGIIYDPRVDKFVETVLPVASHFEMTPYDDHERLAARCPLEVTMGGVMLLLIRLLGPPVASKNDPHSIQKHRQLARWFSKVPLLAILRSGFPTFAMLSTLGLVSWRSQRLFSKGHVRVPDIRRVHELARSTLVSRPAEQISSGVQPENGDGKSEDVIQLLKISPRARQSLWKSLSSVPAVFADGKKELGQGQAWRQVTQWLLRGPESATPEGVAPVVYLTMGWGMNLWGARFVRRALQVGIQRMIFLAPEASKTSVCDEITSMEPELAWRILCFHSNTDFERPYDYNNYSKFVLLPLLLSLGVDVAWLDLDIFVFRDPTPMFRHAVQTSKIDVLTTDHFQKRCLNHGVFFVSASDRTLFWSLTYIKWLHGNPFGHDQNGWDAFCHHMNHFEPMLPSSTMNDWIRHAILDTNIEFVTLGGWAGQASDVWRAFLLHMTPNGPNEKDTKMTLLFNKSVSPGETTQVKALRREKGLIRRMLMKLRHPRFRTKDACYEGVYSSVVEGIRYYNSLFYG